MDIDNLNESKLPIVKIDKSLERYKDKILFGDKLEKANSVLKTVGLPKLKNEGHRRRLKEKS